MEYDEIVLFDGVCNLCNSSIRFFLKKERTPILKFASLQSKKGQLLLSNYQLAGKNIDSIVYISQGKAYVKSSAVLRLTKKLKGLYPLLFGFIVFPAFIRDFVYDWIAKNRYKWFGKTESCMLPTKETQERFVDL